MDFETPSFINEKSQKNVDVMHQQMNRKITIDLIANSGSNILITLNVDISLDKQFIKQCPP